MDYTSNYFDVNSIIANNNIESLSNIEDYLNFSIGYTISSKYPNISYQEHIEIAKQMIGQFMTGNPTLFTRGNNIRANLITIGNQRIKNLLIESMIEKDAFNVEFEKILTPTSYPDKCSRYITDVTRMGRIGEIQDWLLENTQVLVDNYISCKYASSKERKKYMHDVSMLNPNTEKALEQLNLEMKLEQYKNK